MAMNNEQLALDMRYLVQRYSINILTHSLSHLNVANVRTAAVICDKFKAVIIRISASRPTCISSSLQEYASATSIVWPFAREYKTLKYLIIVRL
jgi:hypothetical protein